MSYDPGLAQRVREALAGEANLAEKEMFGGLSFLLGGNMAAGIIDDELIVRVGPEGYEEALERAHTRPFDMTGRPMRGWVVVEEAGLSEDEGLAEWLGMGVATARALPPK